MTGHSMKQSLIGTAKEEELLLSSIVYCGTKKLQKKQQLYCEKHKTYSPEMWPLDEETMRTLIATKMEQSRWKINY